MAASDDRVPPVILRKLQERRICAAAAAEEEEEEEEDSERTVAWIHTHILFFAGECWSWSDGALTPLVCFKSIYTNGDFGSMLEPWFTFTALVLDAAETEERGSTLVFVLGAGQFSKGRVSDS